MPYARPVDSFDDIKDEFVGRVHAVVRCTAATVDARDRPRSRVWHPIWEGNTGRLATNRNTLKTRHLARNPYLSLSYFDHEDPWRPVYVDCSAEWDDTAEGKRRTWEMYVRASEPVGYDPSGIWGTPENPEFGVLVLRPWRVELVDGPGDSRVWRAG
jgi:uncharacterized pyridoxamine 5'-phosphate oxidase family protein